MGPFERAWFVLKGNPDNVDSMGRSIPPALHQPTKFGVPVGANPYDPEGVSQSRADHRNSIRRMPRPSAHKYLPSADREEAEIDEANRQRHTSYLKPFINMGELEGWRGPDLSAMYGSIPQPE